jgi:hypothetical protein
VKPETAQHCALIFLKVKFCSKLAPREICITALACTGDGIRAVGMNLAQIVSFLNFHAYKNGNKSSRSNNMSFLFGLLL